LFYLSNDTSTNEKELFTNKKSNVIKIKRAFKNRAFLQRNNLINKKVMGYWNNIRIPKLNSRFFELGFQTISLEWKA
jgi:hypothetical protein